MSRFTETRYRASSQSGFTLMELLITLAILAIVASIAIPAYSRYVAKARQEDARVQLMAIKQAEEMYKLQYAGYTNQTNLLSGWKTTSGRYTFSITNATATTFGAKAKGNIDGSTADADDEWTITQDTDPTNTVNDVTN